MEDDDLPKASTLESFLYENVKHHPKLSTIIDRYENAGAGSHRRSYDWLWSRIDATILRHKTAINAQVLDKALSSDKPVPAGPLQTQGEAADQGGEWTTVKDKKKKHKKKKEGPGDAPEVAAAPAPPKNKGKDKGKGKSKGKGKGQPPTPRTSNNGTTAPRGTPLTAEEKAARPCMFYAHNMRKAGKKCEFLHDDNNVYTGPPPRIANPKGKAKPGVSASVALAAGLIPGAESKAAPESVWTKALACVSSIVNKQQPAGGMLRKLSRAADT